MQEMDCWRWHQLCSIASSRVSSWTTGEQAGKRRCACLRNWTPREISLRLGAAIEFAVCTRGKKAGVVGCCYGGAWPGLLLRATNREPLSAAAAGELLTMLMRSFERLYFRTSAGRMGIFQLSRLAESAPRIRRLKSTFMKRGAGSTAMRTRAATGRQRWLGVNDHSRF